MLLEIVAHSWNYSRLLTYQLSSLILWPPTNQVIETVCCTAEDIKTVATVEWFAARAKQTSTVTIRPLLLERPRLLRRAIGRNVAALATEADLVWFSDCDQPFGEGCLDAVCREFGADDKLCFPRVINKCSHERGDQLIAAVTGLGVCPIDPTDFNLPHSNRRAIGGIQITTGELCRKLGYCQHNRKQQRPQHRWRRTTEDPLFRKILGTSGRDIPVPNVFRIRHSHYGRSHVGWEN